MTTFIPSGTGMYTIASNSERFVLDGTLQTSTQTALYVTGYGNTILVNGSLTGGNSTGAGVTLVSGANVNQLLIAAGATVTGTDSAVKSDAYGTVVQNAGTMTTLGGSIDTCVLQFTNKFVLRNSGDIISLSAWDGLERGVAVNAEDDTSGGVVVNSGHIFGDVQLGTGDDIFVDFGGDLEGFVYGNDGNDQYQVEDGALQIVEASGEGYDAVYASTSFRLPQNVELLYLSGEDDLKAIGNATANTLKGNNGDNSVLGKAGNDRLLMSEGSDVLAGGAGRDTLDLSLQSDGVRASLLLDGWQDLAEDARARLISLENILGSDHADTLTGANDANLLDGLGGSDILSGLAGNDTIDGGWGSDTLTGGAGKDIFLFDEATGMLGKKADTITDFTRGQDRIDLSDVDANSGNWAMDHFAFIGGKAFTAVGQLRYDADLHRLEGDRDGDKVADMVIVLDNAPDQITAGDLILT